MQGNVFRSFLSDQPKRLSSFPPFTNSSRQLVLLDVFLPTVTECLLIVGCLIVVVFSEV